MKMFSQEPAVKKERTPSFPAIKNKFLSSLVNACEQYDPSNASDEVYLLINPKERNDLWKKTFPQLLHMSESPEAMYHVLHTMYNCSDLPHEVSTIIKNALKEMDAYFKLENKEFKKLLKECQKIFPKEIYHKIMNEPLPDRTRLKIYADALSNAMYSLHQVPSSRKQLLTASCEIEGEKITFTLDNKKAFDKMLERARVLSTEVDKLLPQKQVPYSTDLDNHTIVSGSIRAGYNT